MRVRYPPLSAVLFMHSAAIDEVGGGHGVRDMGLLDSALAQPRQTFGGKDLYPDLWTKAAVLAKGIIKNHPFMDGNKRTGMIASSVFLEMNGHLVTAERGEIAQLAVRIANEGLSLEDIAAWFRSHSEPAPGG